MARPLRTLKPVNFPRPSFDKERTAANRLLATAIVNLEHAIAYSSM